MPRSKQNEGSTVVVSPTEPQIRFLTPDRIECDDLWAFHIKARNVPVDKRDQLGYGDVWTWTAIYPDTKHVPRGSSDARSRRRASIHRGPYARMSCPRESR